MKISQAKPLVMKNEALHDPDHRSVYSIRVYLELPSLSRSKFHSNGAATAVI